MVYLSLPHIEPDLTFERLDDIRAILSSRETMFSLLSGNDTLQSTLGIAKNDCRMLEVQALLAASKVYRKHGALQESY